MPFVGWEGGGCLSTSQTGFSFRGPQTPASFSFFFRISLWLACLGRTNHEVFRAVYTNERPLTLHPEHTQCIGNLLLILYRCEHNVLIRFLFNFRWHTLIFTDHQTRSETRKIVFCCMEITTEYGTMLCVRWKYKESVNDLWMVSLLRTSIWEEEYNSPSDKRGTLFWDIY